MSGNVEKCHVGGKVELLGRDEPERRENARVLERLVGIGNIYLLERVTSGRSKAVVFVAEAAVADPPGTHTCFLKIHHSRGSDPHERHAQAYQTTLRPFMPQILATTPPATATPKVAILYVPNAQHDRFVSLQRLLRTRPQHAVDLVAVTTNTLLRWNERPVAASPMSPWEMLRRALSHSQDPDVLAYRFTPDAGSYADRVRKLGITPRETRIRLAGPGLSDERVLPNPIAYLYRPELWGPLLDTAIAWPCGHVHGDLNARNVLTSDAPEVRLALIDFETYDPANLTFCDFAKMELAILETVFDHLRKAFPVTSPRLASCVEAQHVDDDPMLPPLLKNLLRPIRKAVVSIERAGSGSRQAYVIARVAVGLELSRKASATPAERVFGIVYAADALAVLLADVPASSPNAGQIATVLWDE